jgi:hypothetical protein
MELSFIIESGHSVKMEHYVVYSFDSFVADVGGVHGTAAGADCSRPPLVYCWTVQ